MPPQVHVISSQHEADEQQPQSQNERSDSEPSTNVIEELRRQASEMRIEMQRQATRHEKERLQWIEERQRLTTLLKQYQQTLDTIAVCPRADPRNSQPNQLPLSLVNESKAKIEVFAKSERKITQVSRESQKQLRAWEAEENQQNPEFNEKMSCFTFWDDYFKQSCDKLPHTQKRLEKSLVKGCELRSDLDDILTSNCATETTNQLQRTDPEAADEIRNHIVSINSSSCSGTETTSSEFPQATKILPSQAKSDSSVPAHSQSEIFESSLEIADKSDRNIVTRFIRLSPLIPKEKSAFNDVPISREDRLLKRITERRPFGQNGDRTDGNRKRRITPTLLSKSRVFKGAIMVPEDTFSRESTTLAMGQQRTLDLLPPCLLQRTPEKRVNKQLDLSVSGVVQDFNACVESQLSPSREQDESIWRVAANYFSTLNSSPESGCKVNVGNNATDEPILPSSCQAENLTVKPKVQEHNRRKAEEEELRKLEYENAREHGDMTMDYQVDMQSFDNKPTFLEKVQRCAREFEKAQSYLDAKAQFYHNGTDRPIRMPTSRGQCVSCQRETDCQEKLSSNPIQNLYDLD